MDTRGTISTSCSEATSSSSGGLIDVLRDGGRAMAACAEMSGEGTGPQGGEQFRRTARGRGRQQRAGESRVRLRGKSRSRGMTRVVFCHGSFRSLSPRRHRALLRRLTALLRPIPARNTGDIYRATSHPTSSGLDPVGSPLSLPARSSRIHHHVGRSH